MQRNIPKLRFPEFKDEWEEKRLGEICTIYRGSSLSKSDLNTNGKYRCIHYGELFTEYSEVIRNVKSKTNVDTFVDGKIDDILMPTSDVTPQGLAKASSLQINDVKLGGDINILRPSPKTNSILLSYILNFYKKKIMKIVSGSTVRHVYGKDLSKIKYLVSKDLAEQQKIAEFLVLTDDWIQNLKIQKENLKEYKKGMMQKIFSQEIRFRDENGKEFPKWEEKKLSSMLTMTIDNRGKTPPVGGEGIPLIEVNALGHKKIDYLKVTKFVTEETYKNWFRKHLQKDDILFSTVGATALCAMYIGDREATVAQNVVGLRFSNENSNFMYYLLTERKNNHKFKRIQMGAVQPSVKVSQMVKISFLIPHLIEQQKIAEFLTSMDKVIESKQQQTALAEAYKKGLMQRMFI